MKVPGRKKPAEQPAAAPAPRRRRSTLPRQTLEAIERDLGDLIGFLETDVRRYRTTIAEVAARRNLIRRHLAG